MSGRTISRLLAEVSLKDAGHVYPSQFTRLRKADVARTAKPTSFNLIIYLKINTQDLVQFGLIFI